MAQKPRGLEGPKGQKAQNLKGQKATMTGGKGEGRADAAFHGQSHRHSSISSREIYLLEVVSARGLLPTLYWWMKGISFWLPHSTLCCERETKQWQKQRTLALVDEHSPSSNAARLDVLDENTKLPPIFTPQPNNTEAKACALRFKQLNIKDDLLF